MLPLTLFGLAFTMSCLTAISPVYQFFAISAIITLYFILIDKEY
ncbi:hypothetical protein [Streptococcus phage vB_SbRt-pBovineB21]|nr:hypothetical protein [Streptococcus phage vB_SbRt-pBovineB21]